MSEFVVKSFLNKERRRISTIHLLCPLSFLILPHEGTDYSNFHGSIERNRHPPLTRRTIEQRRKESSRWWALAISKPTNGSSVDEQHSEPVSKKRNRNRIMILRKCIVLFKECLCGQTPEEKAGPVAVQLNNSCNVTCCGATLSPTKSFREPALKGVAPLVESSSSEELGGVSISSNPLDSVVNSPLEPFFILPLMPSLILLVAMIGAIVLTMHRTTKVKRQDVFRRNAIDSRRTIMRRTRGEVNQLREETGTRELRDS